VARGGITDNQLMGYKALALAPGLSGRACHVGAALLDHFNRKSGQCDPSQERLAVLLDMDKATVKRALAELCDDDGRDTGKLFARLPHRGKSHRTAYVPRWSRFDDILSRWSAKMVDVNGAVLRPSAGASTGAELRPSQAQNCAIDRRRTAPQTRLSNPMNKPLGVSTRQFALVDNTADGLSKWGDGPAWEAAHRRVNADLQKVDELEVRERGHLVDRDGWARSIAAELRQRGAGIGALLAEIGAGQ